MTQPGYSSIVLLTIDCLRADHVGCYGYGGQTTPHLDQLAASGTVFLQAIAQGPGTTFSFPALMSSTYASMLGGWNTMSADRPLLAATLRDAGYATAAFVSNPYLSPSTGYDRGFETFDECYSPKPGTRKLLKGINRTLRSSGAEIQCPPYPTAGQVTSRACNWLAQAPVPFFLWVHYMDAHWPYNTQRCTLIPPWDRKKRVLTSGFAHKVRTSPGSATQEEITALQRAYDNGVSYIDEQAGQLLRVVQSTGRSDEAWIIATADHGEAFGEHDMFFHNPILYEELVHVPLIVRFPRAVSAPHRIQRQVRHLDIAPTLLDALGLPQDERHRGTSLLPLLADPGTRGFPAISEVSDLDHWILALRREGWKLILYLQPETLDVVKTELYDLQADPRERSNLAANEKPRVSAMHKQLLDIAHTIRAEAKAEAAPQVEMDEEVVERLRALGYVG